MYRQMSFLGGFILNEDLEWPLDKDFFQATVCRFGKPDIDLYAQS